MPINILPELMILLYKKCDKRTLLIYLKIFQSKVRPSRLKCITELQRRTTSFTHFKTPSAGVPRPKPVPVGRGLRGSYEGI
jgi:hypothetical protein